jgi:hypothetical protein
LRCPSGPVPGPAGVPPKRTLYAAGRATLPMSGPSLERHSARCGVARDAGSAE